MLTRREFGMTGIFLGITTACGRPAASRPERYMIASNRFGLATDWGVSDSGFLTGSFGMTGRGGGNGGALFRHHCRRYRFTTGAWAPKGGRFLWANSATGIVGVLDGLFPVIIQKVELRSTAGDLIDTIKWNGESAKTLAPGEAVWSDACANLDALASYDLDVFWAMPESGAWPSQPVFYLAGERGASHLTTNYAVAGMPTSPTSVGNAVGGMFGPSMFVGRGWDGETPCALLFGDSILDYTSTCAALANARNDRGFLQQALGDVSGGVMTWATTARYSSASISVLQDNLSGFGGRGVIDWLAGVFALLGDRPPMTAIIDEHGRNNMGAHLAQQKTWLQQSAAKVRGHWPDVRYLRTTCTPYTTVGDNTLWTNAESQTMGVSNAAGGALQQWNDWLIAGADGHIDGHFDTAAAVRSASDYGKWATRPFATTLLDAVAANTTITVRLADAPAIGETLVFEPGDAVSADAGSGYCVVSVTPHAGGGHQVTFKSDNRLSYSNPPSIGYDARVAKAHAAGAAVRAVVTRDGLHPGHWGQMAMRDVVIASKALLRNGLP